MRAKEVLEFVGGIVQLCGAIFGASSPRVAARAGNDSVIFVDCDSSGHLPRGANDDRIGNRRFIEVRSSRMTFTAGSARFVRIEHLRLQSYARG